MDIRVARSQRDHITTPLHSKWPICTVRSESDQCRRIANPRQMFRNMYTAVQSVLQGDRARILMSNLSLHIPAARNAITDTQQQIDQAKVPTRGRTVLPVTDLLT